MNALTKALDQWFGRGDFSITTPPMDGLFRPNDLLDDASVCLRAPAPDGLAVTSQGVLASSGRALLRVDKDPQSAPVAIFDADVTALTGLPDGGAAVGLTDGRILFAGGARAGHAVAAHPEVRCITALAPARDGALLVANGSARYASVDWKRDLMATQPTGSLWRLDPEGGIWRRLADGLAYPQGVLDRGDCVVVSESWRCALTRVSDGARPPMPVMENLPAYPSRLTCGDDGAIWLALFAPRSQLVEFVLREPAYRKRMVAEVDPDNWVAPCLRSGRSPLEPIQQGGVKQLGVLKPWSPSRSFGLVVRLDGEFNPKASFHSRANGRRHGVTCCLSSGGRVYFTAKATTSSRPSPIRRRPRDHSADSRSAAARNEGRREALPRRGGA